MSFAGIGSGQRGNANVRDRRGTDAAGAGRALITMAGIGKQFTTGGSVHEAVRHVDLEVAPGEFVSLLGPSGCGKSTLLNIVAGYEDPTSGELTVRGKPIRGPGTDRVMVFQEFALFPWRTVRSNVEFGLEMTGVPKAERRETATRYLEMVGLAASERKYPIELSGGMKQRTAIARALAIEPEILLLDEPFGALDAQTRDLLQEELLRIWMATQRTILFVTHSIEESIYLSDRIVVMTAGPGARIKQIIDLSGWDRPRDRSSADFSGMAQDIRDLLRPELEHIVEEEREG